MGKELVKADIETKISLYIYYSCFGQAKKLHLLDPPVCSISMSFCGELGYG